MAMAAPGVAASASTSALSTQSLRSSFTGERCSVSGGGFLRKTQLFAGKRDGSVRVKGVVGVRARGAFDHIPKQFRGEGLKEGMMENFRTLPKSMYGLNPTQMDMFMTEDSPIKRQAERVTETTISSAKNYQEGKHRNSFEL